MSKRFRIAFSFAGEKRTFVADVAGLLAERYGADRIESGETIHPDADTRNALITHMSRWIAQGRAMDSACRAMPHK